MRAGLGAGPFGLATELLVNDLEPAARRLCPAIDETLDLVRAAGAARAMVSGSGPTVLGLFADPSGAERAAALERTTSQVLSLIEAPGAGIDLPLDIRGTAFQRRVWAALTELPAGSTASYAEIARRIGAPKAVRAVAQACAANALAVVIPCHRVVRSDGALSGYRWGIPRKRALLAREGGQ